MWRATWKGLIGHRLRLALTALAITLGVGFVAGAFIFTDSLNQSFKTAFDSSTSGFDVQVRPVVDPELTFAGGEPLDEALVDQIEALDGVAAAQGTILSVGQLIDQNGEVVGGGPPTFIVSWPTLLPNFSVKSGERPDADGEAALDPDTAQRISAEPGTKVSLVGVGAPEEFIITGTASLEELSSFAGLRSVYVTLETAQRLTGQPDQVATIEVAGEPGVSVSDLVDAIATLLPERAEAVSAQAVAEQNAETFQEALGFLNTFLLVFAGVALFVGAFLIQNTFRIVVAQRVRELALLRVVGATRRQVTRMVVLEAVLVAILASLAGVGVGVALALLIRFAFEATGGNLGDAPLTILPRTIVVALAVGVAVTTISALFPAVQASRVPPVAALRGTEARAGSRSLRRRAVWGFLALALGLSLLGLGLFVNIESERISEIQLVGAGAAVMFIGVAVLAPLFARTAAAAIGAPLAARFTGRLARENAMRSPTRTAATASALMIGLALVGMTLVLADSIKYTTRRILEEQFKADFVIGSAAFGGVGGFSPEVAARVAALPEVDRSTAARFGPVRAEGKTKFVGGADVPVLASLVDFDVIEGSVDAVGEGTVAVLETTARDLDLAVGDPIEIVFARTGAQIFEVGLVFASETYDTDFLLTLPVYEANVVERQDVQVLVALAEDIDLETGRTAIEAAISDFVGINVSDQEEFQDQIAGQINIFLAFIFAMLALAIVIAVFGITNTLSLSVIERTREIGLLRAVGMTRRQLWAMVTGEAVVVAVFGAVLGVVIGIGFGWAVVRALAADNDVFLSIPWWQLGLGLVLAALAGIVAAVFPAWRASKLDLLTAISYE